jgi:3-oxoacyl-[acyl-carrier protein] reductase
LNIIVTGASRGVGFTLMNQLAKAGHRVTGLSRTVPPELPIGCTHRVVDLTDEVQVRAVVRSLKREGGQLDGLVSNAGIAHSALGVTVSQEAAEDVVRTNLIAAMTVTREVAKAMLPQRSGRIVHISSVAVPLHMEGASAYAASKAGMEEYSRVLARELSGANITINVVRLSLMDTDMYRNLSDAAREKYRRALTVQRLIEPEELVHAVGFFLHPQAACVTGQVLTLGLAG